MEKKSGGEEGAREKGNLGAGLVPWDKAGGDSRMVLHVFPVCLDDMMSTVCWRLRPGPTVTRSLFTCRDASFSLEI